jgi:hypothetical protein
MTKERDAGRQQDRVGSALTRLSPPYGRTTGAPSHPFESG